MRARVVLLGVACPLLLLLAPLLLFWQACGGSHGHGWHRLLVRATVVRASDERPVLNASVFVIRRMTDPLDRESRSQALRYFEDPAHGRIDDVLVMRLPVSLDRSGPAGEVEVHASRWHTIYWSAWGTTSREDGPLPELVVVEHPDFQTARVPIDPDTSIEETESEWIVRIDLGTIRLQPKPGR